LILNYCIVEALVSLRRVQKYLVGEEKLNQIIGVNESATCMVEIENLSIDSTAFSSSSKGVQILKNVNLKIDKNELAVISGKVGSGKCIDIFHSIIF
jgi:ABC-type multidrug transport system fused ATPase/permease subunit